MKYITFCPRVFMKYKSRNNHYFFLDFCWNSGSWLMLVSLFIFPEYPVLNAV